MSDPTARELGDVQHMNDPVRPIWHRVFSSHYYNPSNAEARLVFLALKQQRDLGQRVRESLVARCEQAERKLAEYEPPCGCRAIKCHRESCEEADYDR